MTYAVGVGAGRTRGFFACSSMEEDISFFWFCPLAAKTRRNGK